MWLSMFNYQSVDQHKLLFPKLTAFEEPMYYVPKRYFKAENKTSDGSFTVKQLLTTDTLQLQCLIQTHIFQRVQDQPF